MEDHKKAFYGKQQRVGLRLYRSVLIHIPALTCDQAEEMLMSSAILKFRYPIRMLPGRLLGGVLGMSHQEEVLWTWGKRSHFSAGLGMLWCCTGSAGGGGWGEGDVDPDKRQKAAGWNMMKFMKYQML